MKATTAELREPLSGYLSRAQYGGERITITCNGKPVAVIVSVEDLELLRAGEDHLDLTGAREALREPEAQKVVSWSQIKAETRRTNR